LSERVDLAATRQGQRGSRLTSIFAIRIRILCLGYLQVNVARFIFAIENLQTSRFEIMRGKCHRGFLRLRGGTMKERQRSRVILTCKCHLSEGVGGRTREIAFCITIENFLEIGARASGSSEVSIAFAE
jgi:hypothetical protein